MKSQAKFRPDFWLLAAALMALFLNGWNIWEETYANTYYTVAVASMMENFHNFFYASLDSAGSVTVDKPPVAFWIQTISALIFGLHGWSVILPQTLAGVGSVILVYLLVKPSFGIWAARIAAFGMTFTPVAVAVSRTNNIDSLLVFTLLLASWLLFRAVRKGGIRSLLGAFAVIGIGFNMKMLQAYMVLPAFYLFYLLAAKYGWKKKVMSLAAATAIVAVVSVSWAVLVDSVPASERPFIGSSGTDSVLNLAFGYNGVSRLTGDRSTGAAGGSGQSFGEGMPNFGGQASNDDGSKGGKGGMPGGQDGGFGGANGGGVPGGNGGGMFNTGEAGPLRLFQSQLSGQASWLIPLGLIGALAISASWRRRNFTDKHKEIIFWLAWLVPVAGFFSIAGFFHQYYLIMLAPPASVLAGAAITEMWDMYRNREGWSSWLLPVSVLATAAFSWFIIHPYDDTIGSFWSIGVLILGSAAAALLLAFKRGTNNRLQQASLIAALAAMFVGPIYWSFTPIVYGQNSQLPAAGPDGGNAAFGGGFGGISDSESANQELLAYLREHNTGEPYLMAVTDYTAASPYMIDEGESLVILNGFNASDEVYTPETLEALVRSGKVKYFLLGGGMGGGRGGNSEVTDWIAQNGTEIPNSEWENTANADTDPSTADTDTRNPFGFNDNLTLYEVTLPE